MDEIEKAEKKAMHVLSEWVNAMMPKFNAIEMQSLKTRLTTSFREYESREAALVHSLKVAIHPLEDPFHAKNESKTGLTLAASSGMT